MFLDFPEERKQPADKEKYFCFFDKEEVLIGAGNFAEEKTW